MFDPEFRVSALTLKKKMGIVAHVCNPGDEGFSGVHWLTPDLMKDCLKEGEENS